MSEQSALDLVSLGECLVELYRRDDDAFTAGVAGDAFNTLFYASRLGCRTGFVSAVGNDLFTPSILTTLGKEGIDTSSLLTLENRRNGIYFIELDEAGEYTFHFWRAGSAATQTLILHDIEHLADYITRAECFLLTGVTLAVMESPERLAQLLALVHGRTRIVFDTNYRTRLWRSPEEYRTRLEEILPFVDIFLPSAGDLRTVYPAVAVEECAMELCARGPSLAVIKDGSRGWGIVGDAAVAWQGPEEVVTAVDATGAGDAFNAGVIAGLTRGLAVEESARLGERTARCVLRVRGAIDTEFGKDEERREKNKKETDY